MAKLFRGDIEEVPVEEEVDPDALELLIEDFEDALDSGVWEIFGSDGTAINSARLRIPMKSGYNNGMFTVAGTYKLTNSEITFEAGFSGGDTSGLLGFVLEHSAGNTVKVEIELAAGVKAMKQIGGSDTVIETIDWDPTDTKFLKMKEEAGTIHWYYSADGDTWTEFTTLAVPAEVDLDELKVVIFAGAWNNQNGFALVDNINVTS